MKQKDEFIKKLSGLPIPPESRERLCLDLDTLLKEAEGEGYRRGLRDHNPIRQKRIRKPKLRF